MLRLTDEDSKWVSSGVGRHGVSQFTQFSEDSDRRRMVDQNWSCTALHRINERESNGKPAKTTGDKTVGFSTQLYDNFSQLLPQQRRQKCLLVSLMLNLNRYSASAQNHRCSTSPRSIPVYRENPQGSTRVKCIVNRSDNLY